MTKETVLSIRNLTKKFGNVVAVNNLSIDYVNKGEFITFLGPSGCGKTTLLRMIGGFYYPTSGEIIMHGEKINEVPPEQRRTSMVFQNYALFPHMTVFDNIAYGLKLRKFSKSEIKDKVLNILKIVKLEGMENRKPSELSGGQQQRVALARCIVIEPAIILLDEPLSNLDANLRILMREEIRKIQRSLNLTTIFVTHDQEEAMSMSDRIVVMKDGKIQQIGTPVEIYDKPANLFVASFIGYINLLEGKVVEKTGDGYKIETKLGSFYNKNLDVKLNNGENVTAVIRPEAIEVESKKTISEKSSSINKLTGTVLNVIYVGAIARYRIKIKDEIEPLIVDVSNPIGKGLFQINDKITVYLPERFHCINETG